MILYKDNLNPNLADYGIEIPLLYDRIEKVREVLEQANNLPMTKLVDVRPINQSEIALAHTSDYVSKLYDEPISTMEECFELIKDGKPYRYNPAKATKPLTDLRDRSFLEAYGTKVACEMALEHQFCHFLGGGMHHAMDFGSRGFCVVNDIVIAIRDLQKQNKIKTAWVIDIDAHKGDGTAQITKDDPTINTLSIHMAKGWPLDEESGQGPWDTPSTVDIPIESGEEDFYNSKLQAGLNELAYLSSVPDLAIVVNGADPYAKDAIPSSSPLKLTLEQLLERNMIVYNFLKEKQIPQAYVMAGGYGPDSWEVYTQFLTRL